MEIVRKHPEYVRRVHRAGRLIYVWVVDRMDDLDICVELGVDAVITNRPERVLKQLQCDGVRR